MAKEEDNGDIPPAFGEDMTLREMKSNKGALKVRAEAFVSIKSPGSATQVNELYTKLLAKCNFLHRAAHQLPWRTKRTPQPGRTHRTNFNLCKIT